MTPPITPEDREAAADMDMGNAVPVCGANGNTPALALSASPLDEMRRALEEASKILRVAAGAIGDGTTLGGLAAAHVMRQAADKYDGICADLPALPLAEIVAAFSELLSFELCRKWTQETADADFPGAVARARAALSHFDRG